MRNVIALGIVCTLSVGSTAWSSPRLDLGLALFGKGVQSELNEARTTGTEIEGNFQQAFSEVVDLNLGAGLQLETGSHRARYTEEFKPKLGFRLREASVKLTPTSGLTFQGGALDQNRWSEPLLIQDQSFPSLLEAYETGSGKFRVRLALQQAILADTSNLQPWGDLTTADAHLFVERVGASYGDDDSAKTELHLSHYLFESMSHAIANASRFLGNTVTGTKDTSSQFVFGFQGFEVGSQTKVQVSPRLALALTAAFLVNALADSDRNKGYRVRLTTLGDWNTFQLAPFVEWFRMESDVVPGVYNDRAMGHANRTGFSLGVAGDFVKEKIQAALQVSQANLIQASTVQSDQLWFQLRLRTTYDIL